MISKYLYTFIGVFLCLQPSRAQLIKIPSGNVKTFAAAVLQDTAKTDPFFTALLNQYPQYFDTILNNRKKLNVQIIYTQVDRNKNGITSLKNFYFNADENRYFYPASTVKLPVSLLALQKLNELRSKGINVNLNTTIITGMAGEGQTAVYNDPTTFDGKPIIANYIKKIMMVSDNDAYNRLYEFLGRQYINGQLHKLGFPEAQIVHRLQLPLSPQQNSQTNPIQFLDYNDHLLYSQPMLTDSSNYKPRKDSIGECYYNGDTVINHPMDFSLKNRISLQSLHTTLIGLVFPNQVPSAQRFNLSDSDRNFVLKYMSQLPTESILPPYFADTANYWPAYGKFLLMGAEKNPMPKNIRIFNKIGDAYGQLTDIAYIVDFDKKVEFFLSATIYCNGDDILNKDKYDYQSIGLPFLKHLGEVLYQYNLKRSKAILPDLSNLIFTYDGK